MQRKVDPMTFAVLAKRFDMIGAAMIDTGLMSARSPILNAVRDFSTGIFDATPRLIEQEAAIPAHTCGTHLLVESITKEFKGDIQPGDMLLSNSPFRGGAHICDLTFCAPVFIEGEHLFWAVTRGHQADVGEYATGGSTWMLSDMYKEGIHIPPLRIEQDWKPIRDVVDFYFENIRYRDRTEGDFWAMVASARVGERRLIELCKDYGKDVIKQFIEEFIDYADERMTEELLAIPDGEVEAEAENDSDQFGNLVIARCKMIKKGDQVTIDLTGSSDQVSAYNSTYASSVAAAGLAFGYCIAPDIPKNAGFLKHIHTITRPGSICHVVPPGASFLATTYVPDCISNAVFKCIGELAPEKATAGWGYLAVGGAGAGIDTRGKTPRPYSGSGGLGYSGSGATKDWDGWPYLCTPAGGGGLMLPDIEVIEYQSPLLVHERGVYPDAAGDGQWRGGWATQGMVQPVNHDTQGGGTMDGGHVPGQVFGLMGGSSADTNYSATIDLTTGKETPLGTYSEVIIHSNEAVIMRTGGGGGWGNPLDRDPEMVRNDTRNGIISLKKALNVYGVVLDTNTELYNVNFEETKKHRAKLRKGE